MNSRPTRERIPVFSLLLTATLLLFIAGLTRPSLAADNGCTEPDWLVTGVYLRGEKVTHKLHEWSAKRVSEGVEPGTHKPTWRDLGACAAEPPPPPPPPPGEAGPMEIFGVWHAGNHYADWALPRDTGPGKEFDVANRWIIDRGDGIPSVNLVVLSFLQPMQVLNMTPGDPSTGVPLGMTQDVVEYFGTKGIRVMMSIGGVTYTDYWDEALATDATRLGRNAAEIASHFGVGIEIDYERNTDANLEGLQKFIDAYRSVHPFDASGVNHAARLTIDLAAGGRYLQELNRHATIHWLDNADPVLDYANAMVHRSSGTPDNWQEHIDGMLTYNPQIPPKAPNRFTGGLYLKGSMDNCTDFYASEQQRHADYVLAVPPNGAGVSRGMLGYMFWAAELPSARKNYKGTIPPNTCEDGMGTAMDQFEVVFPMEPLRQN